MDEKFIYFNMFGTRYVDPYATRSEQEYPYSFDPYYLFGDKDGATETIYSDRMSQWDYESYKKAFKFYAPSFDAVAKMFNVYYEGKLDEPLTVENVCGLARGCNVSSGYPYLIFFLKDLKFKKNV